MVLVNIIEDMSEEIYGITAVEFLFNAKMSNENFNFSWK